MTENKIYLEGRGAIVTGGASGIGLSIVQRLFKSGANVSILDLNQDAIDIAVDKINNTAVSGIKCDVSNASAVANAINQAKKKLGTLDIAVNNAGISGPNLTSWEYPIESWQEVIDINLTGTFLISRAVISMMLEAGYGRIVNIASVAGKDGNANASAYSSSKAAVLALTKTLGKELAEKNIAVNAITPAGAKTRISVSYTHLTLPTNREV